MINIGDTIKMIRAKKNLSLDELSNKCGVSKSYISKIENNHQSPSIDYLEKLCFGLDIPLGIFIILADKTESTNFPVINSNIKKMIYDRL